MRISPTADHTRRVIAATGFATALLTGATACTSTATNAGTSGAIASAQSSVTGSLTSAASSGATSPSSTSTAPTSAPTSTAHSTTASAPPTSSSSTSSGGGIRTACLASNLAGKWTGIPGSAGAGHISSDLALQNTSTHACTIDGFPAFTLHSATNATLPTTISFDPIPVPMLIVQPGGWVHSELRYSTDIPSSGEPTSGPCEPSAASALVTITGNSGSVRAALDVPQPICGRGQIEAKPYASGPSSPVGG
jgi:hypothetical protein